MMKFIFLICTERSGSNFITSLLNGHSAISGPPPTHLFRLFGANASNYGDLSCDDNWETLVEDVALNFSCQLGVWNTSIESNELMQKAEQRSAAELLRVIYEQEAAFDGADYIFVKENHTWRFVPFLDTHFRECRYLFMVRDPRDVAASWVTTAGIPGGVKKAVDTWETDQTAGYFVYHQMLRSGRIHFVRYEDLVNDTERSLHAVLDFIGASYEEKILDFYMHYRTIRNADQIDAWKNLSKPVLRNNTGKYRDVLSKDDLRYIELRCRHFDAGLRV